jgi:hypothetical protein
MNRATAPLSALSQSAEVRWSEMRMFRIQGIEG